MSKLQLVHPCDKYEEGLITFTSNDYYEFQPLSLENFLPHLPLELRLLHDLLHPFSYAIAKGLLSEARKHQKIEKKSVSVFDGVVELIVGPLHEYCADISGGEFTRFQSSSDPAIDIFKKLSHNLILFVLKRDFSTFLQKLHANLLASMPEAMKFAEKKYKLIDIMYGLEESELVGRGLYHSIMSLFEEGDVRVALESSKLTRRYIESRYVIQRLLFFFRVDRESVDHAELGKEYFLSLVTGPLLLSGLFDSRGVAMPTEMYDAINDSVFLHKVRF